MDHATAHALLQWQWELGATEAVGDSPVNRYEERAPSPAAPSVPAPARMAATAPPLSGPVVTPPPPREEIHAESVAEAQDAARKARNLSDLAAAMAAFPHCDLRRGARNCVFGEGTPGAVVMVIGDPPERDEDVQGRPFVGRAGQLLDRMFDAIGLGRTHADPATALYVTPIVPWRPPENHRLSAGECAMMLPFLARHVELVDPKMLVIMGNTACGALLGMQGPTRLRGTWQQAFGRPALVSFHPTHLLKAPEAKREAWADLLALQARIRSMS